MELLYQFREPTYGLLPSSCSALTVKDLWDCEEIPRDLYFAIKLFVDARRRRRSVRVHSMTRMESAPDNFASG